MIAPPVHSVYHAAQLYRASRRAHRYRGNAAVLKTEAHFRGVGAETPRLHLFRERADDEHGALEQPVQLRAHARQTFQIGKLLAVQHFVKGGAHLFSQPFFPALGLLVVAEKLFQHRMQERARIAGVEAGFFALFGFYDIVHEIQKRAGGIALQGACRGVTAGKHFRGKISAVKGQPLSFRQVAHIFRAELFAHIGIKSVEILSRQDVDIVAFQPDERDERALGVARAA